MQASPKKCPMPGSVAQSSVAPATPDSAPPTPDDSAAPATPDSVDEIDSFDKFEVSEFIMRPAFG